METFERIIKLPSNVNDLRKIIFQFMEEGNRIILNCMDQQSLTDAELGIIIGCQYDLHQRGGDMVLVADSDSNIRKRLDQLFNQQPLIVYPNIDSARRYAWMGENRRLTVQFDVKVPVAIESVWATCVSMAESIGVSLDARDRLLLEEGCSNTVHSKGKQATVEINISPRLYELTITDEGLRDSESEKRLIEKLEEVKEIIAGKRNFDFESPNGRGILMMMQTAKVTYDFGVGKKTTIHIVRDKTKK